MADQAMKWPGITILLAMVPMLMAPVCGSEPRVEVKVTGSWKGELVVQHSVFSGGQPNAAPFSTVNTTFTEVSFFESIWQSKSGQWGQLSILRQPLEERCRFVDGPGVKGPHLAEWGRVQPLVTTFTIHCEPAKFTVGGDVRGLEGRVVLGLRAWDPDRQSEVHVDESLTVTENGPYVFAGEVPLYDKVELTVDQQPEGLRCRIDALASDTIEADVTDANVNCAKPTMPVLVVRDKGCGNGIPSRSGTTKVYVCNWQLEYADGSPVSCGSLERPYSEMTATDGQKQPALFEVAVQKGSSKAYHLLTTKNLCPGITNQFCGCVPGDKLQMAVRLSAGESAQMAIWSVNDDYFAYEGDGDLISVEFAP